MIQMNGKNYLSVRQAAEYLGAPLTTIYTWLERYPLPRLRVVGNIMIAEEDLLSFIERRPMVGRGRPKKAKQVAQ